MTQPMMGRASVTARPETLREARSASRDDTATRLLTADDLAARWRVPKAHVYRLTRERGLPTVRLGRYYRYRLAAIEAWESAQEAASNAE